MLLPFLLRQHKVWKQCHLRIFTVARILHDYYGFMVTMVLCVVLCVRLVSLNTTPSLDLLN